MKDSVVLRLEARAKAGANEQRFQDLRIEQVMSQGVDYQHESIESLDLVTQARIWYLVRLLIKEAYERGKTDAIEKAEQQLASRSENEMGAIQGL
jgi:hypothetical protein